jgi:hypothetical protein
VEVKPHFPIRAHGAVLNEASGQFDLFYEGKIFDKNFLDGQISLYVYVFHFMDSALLPGKLHYIRAKPLAKSVSSSRRCMGKLSIRGCV